MALVPYLSETDLADDDRVLLARPINLYRALANSAECLRNYSVMDRWIRYGSLLDARLRELAILQVGYLNASPYEFSHHVKIGHDFGVTDDDITALIAATKGKEHGLGEVETAVLSAAREITTDLRIAIGTRQKLRKYLDDARMVELVVITSYYNSVVRILGSLQIDVEPDYQDYLAAFPLPA